MEDQNKTATEQMLDAMYKNVKMGSDSVVTLLSKVEDKDMKRELTRQMEGFEGYAAQIRSMIGQEGDIPEEEGFLAKLGAKVGMTMNTIMDSSPSHLAEMMIEGATMGVTDMTRLVREHENSNCSEDALSLGREIIGFEEDIVERMKAFL